MAALSIGTFIGDILKFFDTLFELIYNFFNDIVWLVENIGRAISNVPDYLAFLPASVVTLFMSGVTVIIIYKILGRD